MGCDIHIVLEKRTENGWIAINTFNAVQTKNGFAFPVAQSRNYRRFAALAGVRGDGPDPKGFPEDASESAKFLYNRYLSDHHSASHLSVRDASPIFLATEHTPKKFATDYPDSWFFDVEHEEIDDHRIVFWFDN